LEITREIITKKGILGMQRGFWITFNRDTIPNGFYFFSYQKIKNFIENKLDSKNKFIPSISYGISGAFAGVICWATCHPFDTIKTIIQMHDLTKPTLRQVDALKSFLDDEYLKGFLKLYKGGFSSFISFGISSALFFIFYENLKKNFLFIKE